mmetsp:Transcript_4955/g.7344  ORF Transcript_4955/g.7344 Transcript_4955/m.7344 type:complete len:483 (-) Transcript_4955:35-1483(-)
MKRQQTNNAQCRLFSWGENGYQQQCNPNRDDITKPTLVMKTEKASSQSWINSIKQMCTGENHTVFLTTNGVAMSCGNNDFGQLGFTFKSHNMAKGNFLPQVITAPKGSRFSCVSAGLNHTILITDKGEVYSCGDSSFGQCGKRSKTVVDTPKMSSKISTLRKVESMSPPHHHTIWVSCGKNYTILLTRREELYAFGHNASGQLGAGFISKFESTPHRVLLPRVQLKKIRAGDQHTIYLSHEGYVFSCGSNRKGQLGFESTITSLHKPTLIYPQSFDQHAIVDIAAGLDHSIFLTDEQSIYVCGNNEHGELGLKAAPIIFLPMLLDNFKCKSIHCGASHSFFLCDDNSLWACGLNKYGQLGINSKRVSVVHPTAVSFGSEEDNLLRITKVVCGFGNFSMVAKLYIPPSNSPDLSDLLKELKQFNDDVETTKLDHYQDHLSTMNQISDQITVVKKDNDASQAIQAMIDETDETYQTILDKLLTQ